MNHGRWKKWIQLSVYNELTEEEKRLLQTHLDGCEECRYEMGKLSILHKTMKGITPYPVDEQLLVEARDQFRQALRATKGRSPAPNRWSELIRGVFRPGVRFAFAASVSFILGIVLSYVYFHTSAPVPGSQESPAQTMFLPGETRITNIRFLSGKNGDGQVDFTFDAVRPVHMKGNIQDEQVQKVLTYAILNEDNPGVRLRSIDAVAGQRTADKEVRNALITALKSDINAGVRKESLHALQKFPLDEEIKLTLLFVLNHDKNPGLRIAAINLLDSLRNSNLVPDKDILEGFRNTVQTDDNNYIKLRAKAAIEEIKQ